MEILRLIESSNWITDYQIIDYRKWIDGFYYKLKITFIDESVIFAKEYFETKERNYSFHWQTKEDNMINRWDNAPHHKDISTFPHHKHCNDGIFESFEISLVEILEYIHKHFINTK